MEERGNYAKIFFNIRDFNIPDVRFSNKHSFPSPPSTPSPQWGKARWAPAVSQRLVGSLQTPPRRMSPFNLLAPSLGLRVAAGMSVHSQVQFQGASLIYPPVLSLTRGGNSRASAEVGPIYRSWPQRDGCVCLVGLKELLHDKTTDAGRIDK